MLEIFDHLLNYRILYTQQYCNCSTDKCCEAYGCMPSPDPGPLYFVCWPWELLWQRIVWCILFPTKHHTHASAMFSDTNNTYVVTPSFLVCYICYNFSWNPYCWWRHHPFMTSLLPYWWRPMTQFNMIWFNLPISMILLCFISNGAFFWALMDQVLDQGSF